MSPSPSGSERDDTQEPDSRSPTTAQAGVLGNLPKTRPSVRSPRRTKREPVADAAGADPDEGEARSAPDAGSTSGSPTADVEALARGGIAIAGEAATLGLRIAGRAAAALRDAVERR